jgi:hypothetical protein
LEHTNKEAVILFHILLANGGVKMGKSNKSKRFFKQGSDSVARHDSRIPYHTTYAEAEARRKADVQDSSLGGI